MTDSGGRISVDYTTDAYGNLSSIAQDGVNYSFTYDHQNRRTATKVGTQTLASYSYNSRNLLSTTQYGNGTNHTLTYDESDRLIGEAFNGTSAYSYSYNSEGYLGKTIDHGLGVTTYYGYDLVGRVTDVTSSDGLKSEFGYNAQNLISSYSVAKNGTEISEADYDYTSDGLLSAVSLSNGYMEYSYDKLNRLTVYKNYIGGIPMSVRYSYLAGTNSNTTGLESNILYDDSGTKYVPELNYTYYADGNIHLVKENGTLVNSYAYDELGRLTRNNDLNQNKTIKYIYDSRGNILRKDYYNYSLDGNLTYTGAVNYTYDSTWKDKLTSYNGESITYDAIGNPLTYRGYTLTWQKGRQLKSIENSSYDLDFKYNADGLRTEKKVNGITYSYIWSSGLLMQLSGNGHTLKFGYSPDGRVLSVNYNGSDYYYVYNLQGDVIALHNHVGTVVVEYTYDSWGRILSTTGSQANGIGLTNPFRYRGYLYDGETGLYYLRSRYYDPEVCRFISADSIIYNRNINTLNLFVYCLNNPINSIDETGMFPVLLTVCMVGIVVLGGIFGFCSKEKLLTKKETTPINNKPNSFNNATNNKNNYSYDNNQNNIDSAKCNSGYNPAQQYNSNNTNKQPDQLKLVDRVINTVIGAGLGLATAGAIVALSGAAFSVAVSLTATVPVFGVTGAQMFAIGALSFDAFAIFVAPMCGLSTEPIEYK